jgi:hypothetical protein
MRLVEPLTRKVPGTSVAVGETSEMDGAEGGMRHTVFFEMQPAV